MHESQVMWNQIDSETKQRWKARKQEGGVVDKTPYLYFEVTVVEGSRWAFNIFLDPTDTYKVGLVGMKNGNKIFEKKCEDIYCDNLSDVITMMCEEAQTMNTMTKTMMIEVNANDLWDSADHVNFRFCNENSRAKSENGAMFIMDGTSYSEQVEFAEEFGCTAEFVKVYRDAIDAGGEFVMFYHDV